MKPLIGLTTALCLAALPVSAADYSDPTWPCIQRKVEHLSLGLMWPTSIDTDIKSLPPDVQSDVRDLAGKLALRRVDVESLRPEVEAFAAAHEGDPQLLGLVFAQVFNGLDTRRTRIIKGIGDFSLSQIALAEQIDKARLEMDTALASETPDYDKIDMLEERIDWDQVIHSDRQKSITYLCETPQLIEKRLFAIAQMMQHLSAE